MSSYFRQLALLFLVGISSGCVSAGGYGSARTLDAHVTHVEVEPLVIGVPKPGVFAAADTLVIVSHGITDRVEVGGEASFLGLGVTSKFSLLRPESRDEGFNMSFAPRLRAVWGAQASGLQSVMGPGLTLELPLLMGYRFHGNEVTFAPAVVDQEVFVSGNILDVGAQAALLLRVSPILRMGPELVALYPIPGASNNVSIFLQGVPTIQVGLAMEFGR